MALIQYECRRCGKTATPENYKSDRFCQYCGTLLNAKPQPKHWLFQFNPSIYKWFDRIKITREPEQWLVSQHFKLIHKGDLVAIWSSGQNAGVYAFGQIITNPIQAPLNLKQETYFPNKEDIKKFERSHSIYVEYSKLCLEKPLLQRKCSENKILSGMQIFMNPQGTNFRLTPEQWDQLLDYC